LLHITDYIEATGPVWTSWAFPTEWFCGQLLWAVKSQQHPDACMAQYLVDDAWMTQIQLVHNMIQELSLHKPHGADVPGQFKHESCKYVFS
jgi:hypothetical protein